VDDDRVDRGRAQLPLDRRAPAGRHGADIRCGHPQTLNDAGEFNAQVYSPSYLFNGPRPTIAAAPAAAQYGSAMSISTPDAANIVSVNLVSFGADTHQSDMDSTSSRCPSPPVRARCPCRRPPPARTPAGDYMLFIVNKAGVPSVAATVHLTAPRRPLPPPRPA